MYTFTGIQYFLHHLLLPYIQNTKVKLIFVFFLLSKNIFYPKISESKSKSGYKKKHIFRIIAQLYSVKELFGYSKKNKKKGKIIFVLKNKKTKTTKKL